MPQGHIAGAMDDWLFPYLPKKLILAAYLAAPGNEFVSGKLQNRESSAALAANTFGYFLDQPALFPIFALLTGCTEVANGVHLEREMRFPWGGGRHPWLDAVIETETWIVGVESKRYEPYRPASYGTFSEAYRRPVWGAGMQPFEQMRESILAGRFAPRHLDATQLVKHALGLRTQAHKRGKRSALVYLYAEPARWPDGRTVSQDALRQHRAETLQFQHSVGGAEVGFAALPYQHLLEAFELSSYAGVRKHGEALRAWLHV